MCIFYENVKIWWFQIGVTLNVSVLEPTPSLHKGGEAQSWSTRNVISQFDIFGTSAQPRLKVCPLYFKSLYSGYPLGSLGECNSNYPLGPMVFMLCYSCYFQYINLQMCIAWCCHFVYSGVTWCLLECSINKCLPTIQFRDYHISVENKNNYLNL